MLKLIFQFITLGYSNSWQISPFLQATILLRQLTTLRRLEYKSCERNLSLCYIRCYNKAHFNENNSHRQKHWIVTFKDVVKCFCQISSKVFITFLLKKIAKVKLRATVYSTLMFLSTFFKVLLIGESQFESEWTTWSRNLQESVCLPSNVTQLWKVIKKWPLPK